MGAVETTIETAVVLGGASDIGLATVRRLEREGLRSAVLAVRDVEATRALVAHDPVLGALDAVHVEPWDALAVDQHDAFVDRAFELLGGVDLVVCAVGSLGHHSGLPMDAIEADTLMRTNYTGPASALLPFARRLQTQGRGTIAVFSSIAGNRARKSNFVYGSAKSGIDAFAQGLDDALAGSGVRVLVVRPGFVVSNMTVGLDPAPMASTPEEVADAIAAALDKRSRVVWVPPKLGPMMAVLRNVPAGVWRRIAADR